MLTIQEPTYQSLSFDTLRPQILKPKINDQFRSHSLILNACDETETNFKRLSQLSKPEGEFLRMINKNDNEAKFSTIMNLPVAQIIRAPVITDWDCNVTQELRIIQKGKFILNPFCIKVPSYYKVMVGCANGLTLFAEELYIISRINPDILNGNKSKPTSNLVQWYIVREAQLDERSYQFYSRILS